MLVELGCRRTLAGKELEQFKPMFYEEPIRPEGDDFYYTDFISDRAVDFVNQFAADKEKPFFLYVAHTAPHWPLHALGEDIKRYEQFQHETLFKLPGITHVRSSIVLKEIKSQMQLPLPYR